MKSLKVITLVALLSVAANVAKAQTNHLRAVSIEFVVKSQGTSATNKFGTVTDKITTVNLGTAEILKALGTNTTLAPTASGFPAGAYLALDTVATATATNPAIFVVVSGKGTNRVVTPVGNYITTSVSSTALRTGHFATNGTASATEYSIRNVTIDIPNSWTLTLSGYASRNVLDVTRGAGKSKIMVDAGDALWDLTGYGTEGTNATPVLVYGGLLTSHTSVTY